MSVQTEPDWEALGLKPVPEWCEQRWCFRPVETWCVLCEKFLCLAHDELAPRRMHDCVRGRAEDE